MSHGRSQTDERDQYLVGMSVHVPVVGRPPVRGLGVDGVSRAVFRRVGQELRLTGIEQVSRRRSLVDTGRIYRFD